MTTSTIKKIVLASGNAGKVREINKLFIGSGIEVIPQTELNVPEVPETGTTFVENAIIKARHAAEVTGLPAISDDSGIEVDALDSRPGVYSARYAGENAIIKARHAAEVTGLPAISDDSGIEVDALDSRPGVYSARYAGENASDENNNNLMLKELQDVPEVERTARYQCLIVFMRSHTDPVPIITQGSWEGRILEAPQGDGGFGYDPIFYVPTHDCSGGELALDVKNTLSHRAIALNAMLEEFKKHNYL